MKKIITWVIGGGGTVYPKFLLPYNSLRSELSFKPLKGDLLQSSDDKIDIIAKKWHFGPKFPRPLTKKSSPRGMNYINVFVSSTSITIQQKSPNNVFGIRPPILINSSIKLITNGRASNIASSGRL